MRRLPVPASLSAAALFLLASCTAPAVPPPAPPRPVPTPTPAPPPVAKPLPADWRDWPLTSGTWGYRKDARGSIALFGVAGQEAELTLRCDRAEARIYLSRRVTPGTAPAPLTVRTTSQTNTLATRAAGGASNYITAQIPARETLLDAMGFSRGRILVEGAHMPTLVIPAWAEILRVTEDCRG